MSVKHLITAVTVTTIGVTFALTGFAQGPTSASFQGSYSCLGGLQLLQSGPHVSGTSGDSYNPHVSHVVNSFDCNIADDPLICTGTETSVTMKDGQIISKTPNVTPITIRKNPSSGWLVVQQPNTATAIYSPMVCKPVGDNRP